ncbi:MAG: succinylglutamate desuccinylase/aspartoacylase family protein [Ectothiorhodospiraceae bacterium]|nr:succinylglutamate desuccinylase/aspartoacylase family protein [Chromatiales bacterium]MCP5154636.1 succinylglutamate desuccinylase/aspartoacylase family protein [Ectothiorhodospiraceae bacterium]
MDDSSYAVHIDAPDISPWRAGNTGVEFVTSLDSARPGPHVLVTAVVHGNELCGAIVLDRLLREQIRPLVGRLTLAFMNVAAFSRFDPASPRASRFVDEDFNRLWAEEVLDGPRDSVELRRARALRPLVDSADYLLDIHSMLDDAIPLMMAGTEAKGRALAQAVGTPEHVVIDAGHAAGRRMRDYRHFSDPSSPRAALLVECGQHWTASSVAVAHDVTLRFLAHLGIIDARWAPHRLRPLPSAQRLIEVTEAVTIESDDFRFAQSHQGMDVVPHAGTLLGWDGAREIRTPYDDCVLVMPSRRPRRGESAVRLGRHLEASSTIVRDGLPAIGGAR